MNERVTNMLLELNAVYKFSPYFMVCEIIEARNEDQAKMRHQSATKIVAACDVEQGTFQFLEIRRHNGLRPLTMKGIGYSNSQHSDGQVKAPRFHAFSSLNAQRNFFCKIVVTEGVYYAPMHRSPRVRINSYANEEAMDMTDEPAEKDVKMWYAT